MRRVAEEGPLDVVDRHMTTPPTWWPVACLVLVAAALRLPTLGLQSFWYDEMLTASLVRRGFTEMLAHLTDDAHPPLYYVLAWLWINVAGSGEVGLRSLSALLGVATVPISTSSALCSHRVAPG